MSAVAFESILQLLKDNKEFPNYQAERRIDIFINYFLNRLLTSFLSEETVFVCPEFPLKSTGSNRSTKLDYLCKTLTQPVFVELKTDVHSLKEKQAYSYLSCNWENCVSELQQIRSATQSVYRAKYDKLIAAIARLGFNEKNPQVRVVYISPLPQSNNNSWTKVNIVKSKRLSEIDFLIHEQERMIWDFILELDLYIYEMAKSAAINN